jgi:sulfhydrogenase subunit delta
MWRQVSHIRARKKPTLAVFKFASCDGCQLSLLDLEDALLDLIGAVEIAYFLEATSKESKGPFDIAVADGSITTPEDVERLRDVRRVSRFFVALGACATAGGIQALRNFADVKDYQALVYAKPEYLETLATSTAFADHVPWTSSCGAARSTSTSCSR